MGVSCYSSCEIFASTSTAFCFVLACTSSRANCKAHLQKINAVGFRDEFEIFGYLPSATLS